MTGRPDPIATDRRRARRRELSPADAGCAVCGWQTPDLLLRAGRNLLEGDHVDGDVNDPDIVVALCPSCHAVHSETQRRLGVALSHRDRRSPLERRAAALRSRAGLWRQLADGDLRAAGRLEALAAALDRAFPGWRRLPEAHGW